MTWPNQDVAVEGSAGALLLSNALAASVTKAGQLSQLGLLQELIANMIIDSPPAVVITTTGLITSTSSIKSSSASAGVGYGTGAGGIVTQASNKSTAVVLNKVVGQIVTNNAALVAGNEVTFTVTNTAVAATDVVLANYAAGGTTGVYGVFPGNITAGAFDMTISALGVGSYTEAITINFAILKGANA